MKVGIESLCVWINDTKPKTIKKIRKSFIRNGKVIKRKVYTKVIHVKLKKPLLCYNCTLKSNELAKLGGLYVVNNTGEKYICTQVVNINIPISFFKNVNSYLNKNTYNSPSDLTLVAQLAT